MSRTHLVVPRVGRASLHLSWLHAGEARSWDLHLCPYQPLAPQDGLDLTVGEVVPGPKWTGLRHLLNHWDGWRDYEYIWLPDDDLFASQAVINRLFEIAQHLSFDLCAPALNEASYYAHFSTMRNRRCGARRTGFVEIMAPCFRRSALEKLLHTLDLSDTGWGWGLDSVWPKLLDYRNLGVIDAAPVLHTRPVGGFRDGDLEQRVHAESDRILQVHGCRQVHTTFEALGPDLQPLALSADALTMTLVDGWRYLFDSNPAALPWVVEAQRPADGWPPYPTAGTPACGAPLAMAELAMPTAAVTPAAPARAVEPMAAAAHAPPRVPAELLQ